MRSTAEKRHEEFYVAGDWGRLGEDIVIGGKIIVLKNLWRGIGPSFLMCKRRGTGSGHSSDS